MSKLTIPVCTTVNGLSICFYPGLFLKTVRHQLALKWTLNGYFLPKQADSQLGIAT